MSNLPEQTTPVYCTDEDIAVPRRWRLHHALPGVAADGLRHRRVFLERLAVGPQFDRDQFRREQRDAQPGHLALAAQKPVSRRRGAPRDRLSSWDDGHAAAAAQGPERGPAAGALAGLTNVTFTINTLDPQTEEASFDIKRRFGVDENIVDRGSSWIYDLRDLRMATVLSVLLARYTQEARGDKGDFAQDRPGRAPSSAPSSTACRSAGDPSATRPSRRRFLAANFRDEVASG